MTTKVVSVPNISCQHCVRTIQRELGQVPGVAEVRAEVDTKTVTVNFEKPETLDAILETLNEIGYPAAE